MKKLLILLLVIALGVMLTCIGSTLIGVFMGDRAVKSPDQQAFTEANSLLTRHEAGDSVGFGSDSTAIAWANEYSRSMKMLRQMLFTAEDEDAISLAKGEFLTYCQANDDAVIFLVRVPQMRKFDSDAKEALGELAWSVAQRTLEGTRYDQNNSVLVVGVRGAAIYDRVMVGSFADDSPGISDGARSILYPYFAPAAPEAIEDAENTEAGPSARSRLN